MTAIIGVSDNNVAVLETALGTKIPFLRDYATLSAPAPAYWAPLAHGRTLVTSLKLRMPNAVPAVDVTAGKYDSEVVAYIKFLMSLGMEFACFDHEIDAKAAAAGGTTQQLNAAVLHCNKIARAVPGWNGKIVACVTGFDEVHRGPDWSPFFHDADVIMFDQPYATGATPSGDVLCGPTIDWFNANYPGKPLIIGEWGSTPAAGRGAWIKAFTDAIHTLPRYKNLIAALYWDAGTPGGFITTVTGTADQPALVAAIKASLPVVAPPVVTPPVVVTPPNPVITALQAQVSDLTLQLNAANTALATANGLRSVAAAKVLSLTAALKAASVATVALNADLVAAAA